MIIYVSVVLMIVIYKKNLQKNLKKRVLLRKDGEIKIPLW